MTKSKYWKCVRIDAAGNRQILEIAPAKTFFANSFSEFSSNNDASSANIQQQLLTWLRDASNNERRLLAERCLLCFISWQIELCCLQLQTQFGAVHGFTCRDLLPYVLDDDGSLQPPTSYNCFSREILQDFDPEQSNLTTWTSRKVKQHPALNRFLLECGVYLISDWAILNDTQPKQLQRILGEFHGLTPFQPAVVNAISSVTNFQVGEFQVCLIATGSLTDEEVTLPRAVVDLPEYIPHFYILVEVLSEQECAIIQGFLSFQQLTQRLVNSNLVPEEDWTYQLPLTWFENNSDRLLLYLRCLELQAIPLPAVPLERAYNLSRMQNELTALLPQLHSPERELWQVLNWEQGTAVLTSPELLNWVYNLQIQQLPIPHLSDLIKLLTQPALNVGRWLWDELDNLAQELSWVLLPGFAPIGEMRSPTEEFAAIITQLQQTYSEIPLEARAAFKDLLLAGIQLRLYAVTWHLVSESNREWTLLLILGAPNSNSLPHNVKLRVSDQTGILIERGLEPENGDAYIFTRVIGNWDEKFLVSVKLMDGVEVTLPPFAFDLGR